jgi:hypothetical protein
VILFPTDTGLSVICKAVFPAKARFSAIAHSAQNIRLAVSEDIDLESLPESGITPYLPDHERNRAFHTLVQLCDFRFSLRRHLRIAKPQLLHTPKLNTASGRCEAAQQISEATLTSNVSAKTDARFRSQGEKSPGIRA